MDVFENEFENTTVSVRILYAERIQQEEVLSATDPPSLPEEDIEFVMDTFQRSMGKSRPVRDTQLEGEKPQSKESANSTENPGYEEFY
ncbi:hypothetical protein ACLB1E_34540 [Escherichia coli]